MVQPRLSITPTVKDPLGVSKALKRLSVLGALPVRYSASMYEENRLRNPTLTVFLSNGCYLKVFISLEHKGKRFHLKSAL